MSKIIDKKEVENIAQVFRDDPWLEPFEGEIRRR